MKKNECERFSFDWWLNITMYLVFILVFVILIKVIIQQFIPAKPTPPIDYGSLTLAYNGLPFAFWLCIGLGLMFGLAFHGFKLFSINIERK